MKYYDGVLERVRKIEEKNAIIYARPDGILYKWVKIIYIVAWAYGIFNIAAYLLGIVFSYSEHLKDFAGDIIPAAICLVLFVAGLVVLLKKQYIVGAALNIVPATVAIFFFRVRLMDDLSVDTVFAKYYWRHLAPMLIIIFLVCWMAIIAVRARVKTKNQYIRVTENLYNLYKVNVAEGHEISAEQWDEFLKRYDPTDYRPQFLMNRETGEESEE